MDVTLKAWTLCPDELCADAAGVCVGKSGTAKALRNAIRSGHGTVFEHAVFTFKVDGISRACLAQLTRHRLASFDVKSQRYVRIGAGTVPVVPDSIFQSEFRDQVMDLMDDAMNLYQQMVDAGIPAEDARYITPQSVPTTLYMTMNARELRHFFKLRCCNRAQWEIRGLAEKILRLCKEKAPILFENCGPGCVSGQCREARPCGHPRTGEELFEC